jgi:phosphatidylinositol glycan class B
VSAEAPSFGRLVVERAGLDASWRRFLVAWLGIAFVSIGVAALCSNGFHHVDEYFQTLEFAGAKLGRTPLSDLPWEYPARIRSWLQPALYVVIARGAAALGIEDPFSWALAFRFLSGILSFLALGGLCLCIPGWFGESRETAVRALCLAWFVPYLSVRTSSESLSGSCFILGLSLLVLLGDAPGRSRPIVFAGAGALFGLSFLFRFALGVAIAAIVSWAIVRGRARAAQIVFLGLGISLALGLGALVDRWGYGVWAAPAYGYFVTNLVKGRAVAGFGELPWWGFVSLAAKTPVAPLVFVLMAGAVLAWIRKPLHPLTWATAPFCVVHSIVRHKEMRFLFPLAPLAPLLLVLAFAPEGRPWDRFLRPFWDSRRGLLGKALLVANLIAWGVLMLTPTRPQINFQHFVRETFPDRFEAFVTTPSSPWVAVGLQMHFYAPSLVLHQVRDKGSVGRRRFLLVTSSFDPPLDPSSGCTALFRSFPAGIRRFLPADSIPAWDLYRCGGEDVSGSFLRPRAVAKAQQGEIHEGHVDLFAGELGRLAIPVPEMDRDLAEAKAVDPGLVRDFSVDDVPLDLDPLEFRVLQDGAPVGPVPARGVADRNPGHDRDVLVCEPGEDRPDEPPF